MKNGLGEVSRPRFPLPHTLPPLLCGRVDNSTVGLVAHPLILETSPRGASLSIALTKGGRIFANWGLLLTEPIQQIIVEPLSATNNRVPNDQAQKAIPASLPRRTDIINEEVIKNQRTAPAPFEQLVILGYNYQVPWVPSVDIVKKP